MHRSGACALPRGCAVLRRSATRLVGVLALYQFWHWFRPSEPCLVNILTKDLHISDEVVDNVIFPWSTYALLPCTVAAAAVFEVFGFGPALLLAALADVVTVCLVLLSGGVLWPLLASQVTFALSFTAIFVVVAALYALLPPELYQQAASYSRIAALLGTVISSGIGQALVSGGLEWWSLWGTLAGTSISCVVTIAALYYKVFQPWTLPLHHPPLPDEDEEGGLGAKPLAQAQVLLLNDDEDEEGGLGAKPLAQAQVLLLNDDEDHDIMTEVDTDNEDAEDLPVTLDDAVSVSSSQGSSLWGVADGKSKVTARRVAHRAVQAFHSAMISYRSPVILGLSLWSAGLRTSHTLTLTYWQSLLQGLQGSDNSTATVYTVAYIAAAIAVSLPALWDTTQCSCKCSHRGVSTSTWVIVAAGALCFLDGGLLMIMAVSRTTTQASAVFVVFHALTEFLLVVLSAALGREMVLRHQQDEEGSKHAVEHRGRAARGVHFAAVFGMNALVGMVLQIVTQAAVGGLGLEQQFFVFGGVTVAAVLVGFVLIH
jgi:hypothetical protein